MATTPHATALYIGVESFPRRYTIIERERKRGQLMTLYLTNQQSYYSKKLKMLSFTEVELCLMTIIIIFLSQWIIRRWRNNNISKSDGVLPPGSMGLPFIGETLYLIVPSYSLGLHPFVKTRFQRLLIKLCNLIYPCNIH